MLKSVLQFKDGKQRRLACCQSRAKAPHSIITRVTLGNFVCVLTECQERHQLLVLGTSKESLPQKLYHNDKI